MNSLNTLENVNQMDPKSNPEVTVAVISYNGKKVIQLCLDSIFSQTYKSLKVFLVNNASTDSTPEWVKEHYPDVEILDYPENKGPNPARNFAIQKSPNSLVMLVDDDAVLEENCIYELVQAAQKYTDSAVWSPRIVYHDQQDLIQFEGASIHYLTEAILLNGDTPISQGVKEITPIQVAGGVSYLVSKEAALSVDLFDEYYFFGRTDGEFTFRLTQAGQTLYTVPKAVCYHRVKKRGLSKVFYQVRNRLYLMLTTYSWKTILLLLPALMVYEISLVTFLVLKGSIAEYIKAVFEVISDLPKILEKRRLVQKQRRLPDREVIHNGPINIRKDLVENRVIAFLKSLLDSFFIFYWKLIYRFI
ncbi:putative glycosyltransferase [Leptolyngbya sp. PCC 7375]|nr:putative glycosyltransferase [Leptolyngbya sp. PCC 7375]